MEMENNLAEEMLMTGSSQEISGEFVVAQQDEQGVAPCNGHCQSGSCIVGL